MASNMRLTRLTTACGILSFDDISMCTTVGSGGRRGTVNGNGRSRFNRKNIVYYYIVWYMGSYL